YTLSLNGQTRTATGTSGNYVTFSAISGLSEYTTYSWTVTVKDSNNASLSGSGKARTYCSGTRIHLQWTFRRGINLQDM
ncbi:MAG: hypothetical protein HFJ50_10405, partial [Clostridia bacterium]|nr:hypothetical protein [Clostridia bacterium]